MIYDLVGLKGILKTFDYIIEINIHMWFYYWYLSI